MKVSFGSSAMHSHGAGLYIISDGLNGYGVNLTWFFKHLQQVLLCEYSGTCCANTAGFARQIQQGSLCKCSMICLIIAWGHVTAKLSMSYLSKRQNFKVTKCVSFDYDEVNCLLFLSQFHITYTCMYLI